ncbi:SRA stem-loop-interacting RNA-binding protein, mitochondrial-like [Gopherus flavomarginatus]|uniref:SRA stem-loop-interacting RNA-binding protein, mitochondrial-like n=1 Tax=Gopherus flavomarginatus TaxID=286002 RepID=UPI0021CC1547|nr:SRA stem-loop-interacting RNA-binding protein, mitochondrial-like [Gopherus flavomarginatus]
MAATRTSSRQVFELFVSRIHWTLATKELRDYFAQFGTVRRCMLPFDKETGFHKGYCWVGFSSEEGLRNALQKESHILDGIKLQVRQQKPRSFQSQYTNKGETDMS